MQVGPITATLWLINFVLNASLLLLLVRRKIWRELPVFFSLVAVSLTCTALLQAFTAWAWAQAYYNLSWVSRAFHTFLGFAVIHELLRRILYRYEGLRSVAAGVYWSSLVVLLVGATWAAASLPNYPWTDTLTRTLSVLERSLMFMQAGLLVAVFLLVAVCGLSWRRLVFGVAFGMGLYATFKLVIITAYSYMGIEYYGAYVIAWMLNGMLLSSVWLVYAAAPESEVVGPLTVPASALGRWNSALLEVLQR